MFRSSEISVLLSDLESIDGVDISGDFPLFFKKTNSLLSMQINEAIIYRQFSFIEGI